MPAPLMAKPSVPAPFWSTPLKVVVPVGTSVSDKPPATLLVTVPPAPETLESEATVWLAPLRSNVLPLAIRAGVVEGNWPNWPR